MAQRPSGEASYPWLNEFLCEYVDGTMDPAARALFEECLSGSPELMAYVERLRETRHLLCAYGCRNLHAPCNLHQMLHRRIAQEASAGQAAWHLPGKLGMASVVFAALLVMMVGGGAWPVAEGEPAGSRGAYQPASLPAFLPVASYAERALLPDTLPRSAALLRIRATTGAGVAAP